jgi:hypothetical protein
LKRSHAAAGAAGTIVLGVLSRTIHLGFKLWDKSLGDALYTVLVYFIVALVKPSWKPPKLAAWAFGISLFMELFQRTGLARKAPTLLRVFLGTTFAWHDIVCYAVGATVVALLHQAVRTK